MDNIYGVSKRAVKLWRQLLIFGAVEMPNWENKAEDVKELISIGLARYVSGRYPKGQLQLIDMWMKLNENDVAVLGAIASTDGPINDSELNIRLGAVPGFRGVLIDLLELGLIERATPEGEKYGWVLR